MSTYESTNYAEIAARDKQARELSEREGIGFCEAWLRILDASERKSDSDPVDRTLPNPAFQG